MDCISCGGKEMTKGLKICEFHKKKAVKYVCT